MKITEFLRRLRWLDGSPLWPAIDPYRRRLFTQFYDERDPRDPRRPRYNLALSGRAKKNSKTLDLVLGALYSLCTDPLPGYTNDCSILANDIDQARDDLDLAKKLIEANAVLGAWLIVKKDVIERRDGKGFLEILPAGDVAGAHGKSRRWVGYDEIHGYRTWDVFEAMQPDPHRLDAQQWITSYASIHHRPGVPLFDLFSIGKAGTDPRMLFSWYAADFTTDPDFADADPELRANPSMASWADPDYLDQQRRRLPAHKFRRLHLNLPGLPEGAAYSPEPIFDAIERGTAVRPPLPGGLYTAFVDMSGGSHDDAVLAISHLDPGGRAVLDMVQDQGRRVPFDPVAAVARFARTLREYGCRAVTGDKYAGETFRKQFEAHGVEYRVAERTAHEFYEDFEPLLNGGRIILLDVPKLEQQFLGLAWRGSRIDHPPGEYDDYSNAVAGSMVLAATPPPVPSRITFGTPAPRIGGAASSRYRRLSPLVTVHDPAPSSREVIATGIPQRRPDGSVRKPTWQVTAADHAARTEDPRFVRAVLDKFAELNRNR